jgi:hypothetical protein
VFVVCVCVCVCVHVCVCVCVCLLCFVLFIVCFYLHFVDPKCIEYMANGARLRMQNEIARGDMAPGTAGNEGAHFDLKAWGRNVRTQSRTRAVMVLDFWIMSNILRCFASDWFTFPGDIDRPADYATHVLVKLQRPSVASGSPCISIRSKGQRRDALVATREQTTRKDKANLRRTHAIKRHTEKFAVSHPRQGRVTIGVKTKMSSKGRS